LTVGYIPQQNCVSERKEAKWDRNDKFHVV